jgi:hypothetical protein
MADFTITNVMEAYAQDAVDMAREQFQLELDYSEGSLELVEKILSELHDTLPKGKSSKSSKSKPSEDQIWRMAKIWGGYVGEVMRRWWGGNWTMGGARFSNEVISLETHDTVIFPPTKVYKRIVNGPEDNVWDYYRLLKQEIEQKDS